MDGNLNTLLQELVSGDSDKDPTKIRREIGKLISDDVRSLVRDGSLTRRMCAVDILEPGAQASYPVADDFDIPIFILPKVGSVPRNFVELAGEEVFLPTFRLAAACDFAMKYVREGRTDVVDRAIRGVAQSIISYEEESFFRLLAPAATCDFPGKGVLPPRPASIVRSGQSGFSISLVEAMHLQMRRSRRTLTHLLISPDDMSDLRREIRVREDVEFKGSQLVFKDDEGNEDYSVRIIEREDLGCTGRYNINSHDSTSGIFKFGRHASGLFGWKMSESFNDYYPRVSNKVGTSLDNLLRAGETQVYGFDLSANDSMIMPIREDIRMFDDPHLHREQLIGFYGWEEIGLGILDPRVMAMGVVDRSKDPLLTTLATENRLRERRGSLLGRIFGRLFV